MIVRRPLRAPTEDGALLIEPPLDQVAQLLAENRRLLASGPDILGRPWNDLRRLARDEAKKAARAYFARVGEPFPHLDTDSLILAGHQPELVHPGVWVKNFVLHGLARRHGAMPLHLIVDYDTARTATLRLPEIADLSRDQVQLRTLPFDAWSTERPYEERQVEDRNTFASLAGRAEAIWDNWGFRPLLPAFWNEVRRPAEARHLVGECFVAARRAFERRWGCHNWEVPVSDLCRTEAFAWFACHLLADLPRFRQVYNDCVREYRRSYGIRSRHHPVPELAGSGDRHEAPFWAWTGDQNRRDRLFVYFTDEGTEIRTGDVQGPRLPPLDEMALRPSSVPECLHAWRSLEASGFKVRPRAITNTLFARLFVGDLFIHGIGGAKYDELTDEIIRRFYGIEPPRYLVVSGTLRLPLPTLPATEEQRRALVQWLRSLRYNPQRHLPDEIARTPAVRELLALREQWVHRQPETRRGRRERFAVLRDLTERLYEHTHGEELNIRHELERCEAELAANAILRRRDYAACLYPEVLLREFLVGRG